MKRIPIEERFWPKVNKSSPDSCWLWTASLDANGYGQIGSGGRYGRPLKASRVSWEIHNGPIPDGLLALHRCDVPACVNPAHLFLGTYKDNTQDMMAKGRGPCGERQGSSKLTQSDVQAIRAQRACGIQLKVIALRFGIQPSQVSRIAHHKRWAHTI